MTLYEPRWDRDVVRGRQAEMFVERIVELLKNGNGQIEIKRDAWWPLRKRIYVEHWCLRRNVWQPSGLSITTALVWIFVSPQEFAFLIPTDHLRRACDLAVQRNKNNGKAACKAGSHPTRGVYIYEHDWLESRDKTLDEH